MKKCLTLWHQLIKKLWTKLSMIRNSNSTQRMPQSRKNPPYSTMIKTNVGAQFLKFLSKHITNPQVLHKILSRKTLKIPFRNSPNLKKIIATHNQNVQLHKEFISARGEVYNEQTGVPSYNKVWKWRTEICWSNIYHIQVKVGKPSDIIRHHLNRKVTRKIHLWAITSGH